jgi:hypothetical protein
MKPEIAKGDSELHFGTRANGGGYPWVFFGSGKERIWGLVFLQVWQVKDLRTHFSDVWQEMDLEEKPDGPDRGGTV